MSSVKQIFIFLFEVPWSIKSIFCTLEARERDKEREREKKEVGGKNWGVRETKDDEKKGKRSKREIYPKESILKENQFMRLKNNGEDNRVKMVSSFVVC